jgi:carbamoyl-phosphate synthase large subunit
MPKREDLNKILIIGSGPIIIGQACEFDYSGTQACKALRSLGYQIILVNSNPATIMTDPEMADHTYIEPLNEYALTEIIKKERPDALLPNLGGQTALNLSLQLAKKGILDQYNVEVIGVNLVAIEKGEDRTEFKNSMARLGIDMPRSTAVTSVEAAEVIAEDLGYPVVIRPAYTWAEPAEVWFITWKSCVQWLPEELLPAWLVRFWWKNRCSAGRSWNWKWCAMPKTS